MPNVIKFILRVELLSHNKFIFLKGDRLQTVAFFSSDKHNTTLNLEMQYRNSKAIQNVHICQMELTKKPASGTITEHGGSAYEQMVSTYRKRYS